MIRVLLADDHQLVREGIREILAKAPEISVVAVADNGCQAVDLVRDLTPDVVLMDMSMSEMNGIEATKRIVATVPETKVLILSMHQEKLFVNQALSAGAKGYILKDCAASELMNAIRAVAAGKVCLCSKITALIIDDYIQERAAGTVSPTSKLSPREEEVLCLLAEGKNTKEIAFMLNLSMKTVDSHRQQIMKKLNLFSIAELTKYAVRQGLTDIDK